MKKLAMVGYGLVRGREPEINFIKKYFKLRLIGYKKKTYESGIENTKNIEIIYPSIKPLFLIDPFFFFRKSYSCTSFAKFENLDKALADQDIIITHELWNFFSRQTVEIAKKQNKFVATIVFEIMPNNFFFSHIRPYSSNIKIVKEKTDFFIAQTKKAKDYLLSNGINAKKIVLIYPGIILEKFIHEKRYVNDNVKILFVGNFIQKGLEDMLRLFVELNKKIRNVDLWIVGTGPLYILNKINELQKNYNIKYLGVIDHKKIHKIYENCDIFCTLSKDMKRFGIKYTEEQFGYAYVEAMASGLPIISTNAGAIPEILGKNNFIVDKKDTSNALDYLIELIEDEKLRKQIGKENVERAKKYFDAEKQSKKLVDFLERQC